VTTLHTLLSGHDAHPAVRLVSPPPSLYRVGGLLALLLPLLILLLVTVPWQQTALGTGRVIAYAPEDRRQAVEAPISGRIERWLVAEGEHVIAGQPLAEIVDIDPDRLDRLIAGQAAAAEQLAFLNDQLRSYENKLLAEQTSRDLAVAEAMAKLQGIEHKRLGDLAESEIETVNAGRLDVLASEGIVSTREAEVGRMKREQANAELAARDREIVAQRQYIAKVRADADSKVAAVQALVDEVRAKLTEGSQKLLEAETRVARQQAQRVTAPRAGAVLILHGGPGGGLVKEGDVLVTLVPEAATDAVELWVDGNDLPLIEKDQVVRLMFEGWPAIQLPGFPGASAGTYVGRLSFVDATDDGSGKFRVVVVPADDQPPWPDTERLRQGVRTKGWVLLGRVRLGFELWRRVNGFPPLPSIEKSGAPLPANSKKPRIPGELK
jgi:membrane fusion protein, adhesin transport system